MSRDVRNSSWRATICLQTDCKRQQWSVTVYGLRTPVLCKNSSYKEHHDWFLQTWGSRKCWFLADWSEDSLGELFTSNSLEVSKRLHCVLAFWVKNTSQEEGQKKWTGFATIHLTDASLWGFVCLLINNCDIAGFVKRCLTHFCLKTFSAISVLCSPQCRTYPSSPLSRKAVVAVTYMSWSTLSRSFLKLFWAPALRFSRMFSK